MFKNNLIQLILFMLICRSTRPTTMSEALVNESVRSKPDRDFLIEKTPPPINRYGKTHTPLKNFITEIWW